MTIESSERKRAQELLKEEKDRGQRNLDIAGVMLLALDEEYKTILRTAMDGFWVVDIQGRFLDANDAYCRLIGYDRNELLTMRVSDVEAAERPEETVQHIKKIMEVGWDRFETRHRCKDGRIVDVEISVNYIDAGGGRLFVFARDITERKRAEEALEKNAQLLRDTGEMAKVGGWELDLSTKEISWTEEVGRIHGVEPGYKPKLEEGLNFYAPESRPALEEVLKKATETGEPYDLESLFIPSGSKDKIWVRSLGRAVYSGGKIVKLTGTFQNIDKYKRAEEALRESEERWMSLTENSPDYIMLLDLDATILFINRTVPDLTKEQVIGASNFKYVPPEYHQITIDCYKRVLASGRSDMYTTVYHTKEGEVRYFDVRIGPVFKNGQVAAFISSSTDITERKRAEDEIKKLNEELERRVIERTTQLEAVNKDMQKEITQRRRVEEELKKHEDRLEELVKERTQKIKELERQRAEIEKLAAAGLMAARIAHEINNPLAGIKNSFMLVKEAIPEDHRYYEYVGRIDNEINRVARIVRQMFDLYRPDQEIKKEFSVDKTIYEVVALLEVAWRENNITIEIDSKPITMEMPEGLLRQVLYNIFLNAIEASPQGGVVKIMTEVDNEILTLLISDQGVGIPLEVQPRIFELFFTSKDGSRKGLGLGLAVSKDIVEKLGGHIGFESEPGKGTLFRIILPLKSGERR